MTKENSNKIKEQVSKLLEDSKDEIKNCFGVATEYDEKKYKEYLDFISQFHKYSLNNVLLIKSQLPKSTVVAGYKQWKEKHNRQVKKGAKALKILAPTKRTIEKTRNKIDETTNKPIYDKDGNIEKEKVKVSIPSFFIVNVFDISQTVGEPYPKKPSLQLDGAVENYEKILDALKEISPYSINFCDTGDAKGICYKGLLEIQDGMSNLQTVKTLIHEIAHAMLHFEKENTFSKREAEVQAESVAYCVSNYFGLDTSEYSFKYIASWSKEKELKELQDSLNTIKETSAEIIEQMEEKLNLTCSEVINESEKIDFVMKK